MENPIAVFEPRHPVDELTLWAGLVIVILAVAGLIALIRRGGPREQYNRRMLGAMLLFFLALIAGGMSLFSWLSIRRNGPVTLYPSAIETSYGTAAFGDIARAEIVDNRQVSLVDPNVSRRNIKMLVIEEKTGKIHVLSEQNYDLQKILGSLRQAVEQWNKSPAGNEAGAQR